ncbi:methionine/alanine import family NSS transporter small subunit [Shewanella sp. Isolate11]|nr:methionine/alanine import family NSS transporter small subunit [Shewanella sp. Isolate11]MCG9697389.1 methionine/alanine import family NSS transporter small subunit [Shewanella sp. Isolate11]
MSISAQIMMLLAIAITWGGAAICVAIALKKQSQ